MENLTPPTPTPAPSAGPVTQGLIDLKPSPESDAQIRAHNGAFMGGIGGALAGFAALIAVCSANTLLDKILEIRAATGKISEQTTEISNQAAAIRTQGEEIKKAVDMLSDRLRAMEALEAVRRATDEKSGKPTTDEVKIDDALKQIPEKPKKPQTFYLPANVRKQIIQQWKTERDPMKRREVLEQGLMLSQ